MKVYSPFRESSWPRPLLRLRRALLCAGIEVTVLGFVFVVLREQ